MSNSYLYKAGCFVMSAFSLSFKIYHSPAEQIDRTISKYIPQIICYRRRWLNHVHKRHSMSAAHPRLCLENKKTNFPITNVEQTDLSGKKNSRSYLGQPTSKRNSAFNCCIEKGVKKGSFDLEICNTPQTGDKNVKTVPPQNKPKPTQLNYSGAGSDSAPCCVCLLLLLCVYGRRWFGLGGGEL